MTTIKSDDMPLWLLDELSPLIDALVDPANDCQACTGQMPGVLAPVHDDENHIFVQSCDNCADASESDDTGAATRLAAAVGWNAHNRYDDATKTQWRPFIAKPGSWDDADFIAVDPDEYGWGPEAEEKIDA